MKYIVPDSPKRRVGVDVGGQSPLKKDYIFILITEIRGDLGNTKEYENNLNKKTKTIYSGFQKSIKIFLITTKNKRQQ